MYDTEHRCVYQREEELGKIEVHLVAVFDSMGDLRKRGEKQLQALKTRSFGATFGATSEAIRSIRTLPTEFDNNNNNNNIMN